MVVQRLRNSGGAIFRTVSLRAAGGGGGGGGISVFQALALANLKRKASNSLSAIQDTYLSTKQVFERHRVVFTVGTSIASVLTAWAGYSLRQYHQFKLEERLVSIEQTILNHHKDEHDEIKKIDSSGSVSTTACVATAWTSLVLGYGLGWRGGVWFANRKFRREQLKLMGQIKPHRWQFLRRPFIRLGKSGVGHKPTEVSSTATVASLAAHRSLES